MQQPIVSYERWNPFRRPDWRHDRVLRMVAQRPNPGRSTPRDDIYVQGFRRFILRYRASESNEMVRNRLAYENIGLYLSYQWQLKRHDEGKWQVAMLESRILAGQTDEEIAEEMETRPEAVHWYEALFFNVRDRLKAHDWIVDQVLIPAYEEFYESEAAQQRQHAAKRRVRLQQVPAFHPISEPFFDCTIKFFAYFGGPIMLDHVITGFQRGKRIYSRDEVAQYYDSTQRTRIRQRSTQAAFTFVVDRWNVMQLFELHNQIVDSDRSSESENVLRDSMQAAVRVMLSSTPWVVGDEGEQQSATSAIAVYDAGAAELRSDELLLVEAGRANDTIRAVQHLQLPAPGRLIAEEQIAEPPDSAVALPDAPPNGNGNGQG